jgi:carboxyl-terminal processing protease
VRQSGVQLELKIVKCWLLTCVLLWTSNWPTMAFAAGAVPLETQPEEDLAEPVAEPIPNKPVSTEELARFAGVFRQVQNAFVEPVSEHELMEAAIHGLLTRLDPHSEYLTKAQLEGFTEETNGLYGGLGLEVQVQDGRLLVVTPIDDTPASRAGIQAGDVIDRIDGTPVDGEAAYDGVELLRGANGTTVELMILRGEADPISVKLKREVIQVKSAVFTALPSGVGLLRVSAFQSDTALSARRAIDLAQKKLPLQGLILDLRSNPGGYVTSAVGLSDLFLEQGLIVSTKGREATANTQYKAQTGDVLNGAPMIVLINAGTASAAEIVAGALQDHHRAIVIGAPSFGKGSVQSIVPLANGDGLKLTTARYYTPSGKSIQSRGIRPDVLLDAVSLRAEQTDDVVTEAKLSRHLDQPSDKIDAPAVLPISALLRDDYAINQAFHMLRAIALNKPVPTQPSHNHKNKQETH